MAKEYHDPHLGGFFAVKPIVEVLRPKTGERFEHYGVLINLGPSFSLLKDQSPLVISNSSLVCLSPGCALELQNYEEGEHYFVLFNTAFYCVELHDAETSCNGLLFNGAVTPPVINLSTHEQAKMALLLKVISDELQEADEVQGEMLRAVLKRLLILCARNYRKSLSETHHLNGEQTDTIRQFNALVEKHFKEHHQVAAYAGLMFKSPKTLSNLFSKFSERSPLQIIHDRLALEGKRLLFYTDKTVREIAFELGFEEPSHFTRLFKKMTGQTPSRIKEQQKKASSNN